MTVEPKDPVPPVMSTVSALCWDKEPPCSRNKPSLASRRGCHRGSAVGRRLSPLESPDSAASMKDGTAAALAWPTA